MPPELLADVAVRAAIPDADPVFTYRVPSRLRALARTGQLVWAPLRRQRVQGIILDLYHSPRGDDPAPPLFRPDPGAPPDPEALVLRDLEDVADPEAALTPAQIRLARWLSGYYRVPLYEALALMLPPGRESPAWRRSSADHSRSHSSRRSDPAAFIAAETSKDSSGDGTSGIASWCANPSSSTWKLAVSP